MIRADAQQVMPRFLELLRDENAMIRCVTILALRHYGQEASEAIALLKELLEDPDAGVRRCATKVLRQLTGEP